MKPFVLVVWDGVGLNPNKKGNALALARKPNFDYLWNNFPHSQLKAYGLEILMVLQPFKLHLQLYNQQEIACE
jgi:bisphosphoglycerate-independent phosphoglycerate mutase (AlkP superfamily)